jgi:hypothetical protein
MGRGGGLNNLEMVLAAFKLEVLKGEEPGLWYCQRVGQKRVALDIPGLYLPLVDKLWKTKKGRCETQTKPDLDLTAQAVNDVDDVIV